MDDSLQKMVEFFGISLANLIMVSTLVYGLTELLKKKVPSITGGWKTEVTNAIICVLVSVKIYWASMFPSPEAGFVWSGLVPVVSLSALSWLLSDVIHAMRNPAPKEPTA